MAGDPGDHCAGGAAIAQNLRVRRELDETEIAVSKDGLSPELLASLTSDPDATTYQFVFVAGLKDGLPASPPGRMLVERLIVETDSLLKQVQGTGEIREEPGSRSGGPDGWRRPRTAAPAGARWVASRAHLAHAGDSPDALALRAAGGCGRQRGIHSQPSPAGPRNRATSSPGESAAGGAGTAVDEPSAVRSGPLGTRASAFTKPTAFSWTSGRARRKLSSRRRTYRSFVSRQMRLWLSGISYRRNAGSC